MQQVLQAALQLGAVDRMEHRQPFAEGQSRVFQVQVAGQLRGQLHPVVQFPPAAAEQPLQGIEALQLLLLLLLTQAPQ